MKQILLVFTFFVAFAGTLQAQEFSKNALGLRLGDNDDNFIGLEISYQRALSNDNRIEFDLGWRSEDFFDYYKLAAFYQWVKNIDGGLNWYVGPGAGIAYLDFDNDSLFNEDDGDFGFLIAGVVGIEYGFDFPLQLSFDLRPEIGFEDYNDDLELDWGLGVRFQF